MENYERTTELIEVAQNSAGRSSEQFAKYADTVENKVNKLKNTWEQFRINLVDEKTYKKALDLLNNFIGRFTKIDLIDIGAIAIWGLTVGKTLIQNIVNAFRNSANGIQQVIDNIAFKGVSRIEIQSNLEQVTNEVRKLAQEEEILKNKNNELISNIGKLGTNSSLPSLEEQLNKVGYTLDKTNTKYNLLDISTNEYYGQLQLLVQQGKISYETFNEMSQAIDQNSTDLRENSDAIDENNRRIKEAQQRRQQYLNQLSRANNSGVYASALSGAVTTATTSLITGSFDFEETSKLIGISSLSTAISTLTRALPQATQGLSSFMAAGGEAGLVILGLTVGIAGIAYAVKSVKEDFEYLPSWLQTLLDPLGLMEKEIKDSIDLATEAFEKQKEVIENQTEVIQEASDAVNDFNSTYKSAFDADKVLRELSGKINLTEEEQSKLNEATQTMAEIMPGLISYYDKENNAVIKVTDSYKEQIKQLKERQLLLEQTEIKESIKGDTEAIKLGYFAQDIRDEIDQETKKTVHRKGLSAAEYQLNGIKGSFPEVEITQENFSEATNKYLELLRTEGFATYKYANEITDKDLYTFGILIDELMRYESPTTSKIQEEIKKIKPEYITNKTASFTKEELHQIANLLFREEYTGGYTPSQIFSSQMGRDLFSWYGAEDYERRYQAQYNKIAEEKGIDLEELDEYEAELQTNLKNLDEDLRKYTQNALDKQLNDTPLKNENRKSLLQNILLQWAETDESAIQKYEEELKAKGKDFDPEVFIRDQFGKTNSAFQKLLDKVPSDIDKLTDKQYETLQDYFINIENYTSNKRKELIESFKDFPELQAVLNSITESLETKESNQRKEIGRKYGYWSGYGNPNEKEEAKASGQKESRLFTLTEEGQIPQLVLNNIANQAEEMGEDGKAFFDAWIKYFNDKKNFPKGENITEDQLNMTEYLSGLDWSNLSLYNLGDYAQEMYSKELAPSVEEAKASLKTYAKVFGVQIKDFSLGDFNTILEDFNQKQSNLTSNIDQISDILAASGEEITLDTDQQKKLSKFITTANKTVEKGGLGLDLNYRDYVSEDGTMTEEQRKELEDDIAAAFGVAGDLFEYINELKKKDKEDLTEQEKEQLDMWDNGLGDTVSGASNIVPNAKLEEKIKIYESLSSSLQSLESSYESLYSDMREEGKLSASSISGLYSAVAQLNPLLENQGLAQLDLSKILYQTANGWGANTAALEGFINASIQELRNSELLNGELTTEEQNLLNTLQLIQVQMGIFKTDQAEKEWEKYADAAEEAANAIKEAQEAQEDFVKSAGSFVSNYQSAASEMIKNGKVTSSTYSTLANDLEKINERYNLGLSIDNYIDSSGSFNWIKYEKDLEKFIIELQKEGVEANYLTQVLNDLKETHKELDEELESVSKEYEESLKEVESATKSVESANKSLSEAYEDLAEKEKKVTEAQEALNEALYGTGNKRKSALDGMYNYEQLLDTIDSEIDSIKTNLEHIGPNDNISELVNSYGQNMRAKKVNLEAQKRIYENNLSEILSNIGQYSSYYTMQNGRLLADVAALNRASMNDDIKNEIENQIQMYNDSAKKISDIEKQIKQVEQDFLDFRKTYRDKYINLQEKVISTMKEEAQKELQVQQDKYAALEEADNEYTSALEEAIQKQRDLRDQANEWEDLAQKEKKLSLLQRDTSGANQKEILKQQEDIEKSRQSLLDKGIDNIIKGLKDLYSDQKKTRDAELKYQQAVLDNATYINEANAVINSWQTADDLISWFYEHSQEVQNMTNEQLEQYTEELEEMYNNREIYMNTSMEDFINMLDIQENEIDTTITNVAQHLTLESARSLNEVMEKVDEAIDKAREDIDNAIKDVEDAKDKITQAIEAVADAVKKLEEANKSAAEAAEKLAKVQEEANKAKVDISNDSSEDINLEDKRLVWDTSVYQNKTQGYFTGMVLDGDQQKQLAKDVGVYVSNIDGVTWYADTFAKLREKMGDHGSYIDPSGNLQQFATGGLVDYTGPAWVDGTPAQPEAFLSAKDTQIISNFTDVLRSLYTSIGSSNSQQLNPSIGDTHIEVHINIENVASDYDVDQAVERVKQDIIDAANQTGRNVILYQ